MDEITRKNRMVNYNKEWVRLQAKIERLQRWQNLIGIAYNNLHRSGDGAKYETEETR